MPASNHSFFAPASGIRPLFRAKVGRFDVEVGACMKGYVALVAEDPWAIMIHADIDLLRDYMVAALKPYQPYPDCASDRAEKPSSAGPILNDRVSVSGLEPVANGAEGESPSRNQEG